MEALFACKRIPSDNKLGVRPIRIGGEIRRITGHAEMIIFRKNFLEGAGDLQLCQGQRSNGETVIYALSLIFNEENCDAVKIVDAGNAFNSPNLKVMLCNIQITCPIIRTYTINT